MTRASLNPDPAIVRGAAGIGGSRFRYGGAAA